MSTTRVGLILMALTASACGMSGDPGNGGDGGDDGGSDKGDLRSAAAGDLTMAATGDLASNVGPCVAVARTCADVLASFASDATDVKVTCDEKQGTFMISATGVPSYMSNQKTPNAIADQMWVVLLPLNPVCADKTTDVIMSRGPVGFMINGIPWYGPEDAMGRDAIQFEGASFDDCDGHADQSCSYHYHEEPICVFGKGKTAAMHTLADGHSAIIGYALDGFAIYASPAAGALDACNGHVDAKRGYHYHATSKSPYLNGCYAGKETGTIMRVPGCSNTMGTPDGGMGMGMGMPDGGMNLVSCGANGSCQQGFVCCPQGLRCAGKCVPDCRNQGMCMMGLTCDQATGACK